jgi:hypothetical protein
VESRHAKANEKLCSYGGENGALQFAEKLAKDIAQGSQAV